MIYVNFSSFIRARLGRKACATWPYDESAAKLAAESAVEQFQGILKYPEACLGVPC